MTKRHQSERQSIAQLAQAAQVALSIAQSNREGLQQTEQLTRRNANAIAALTSDIQEMKRDRDHMYSLMRDLTQNQIRLYDSSFA